MKKNILLRTQKWLCFQKNSNVQLHKLRKFTIEDESTLPFVSDIKNQTQDLFVRGQKRIRLSILLFCTIVKL